MTPVAEKKIGDKTLKLYPDDSCSNPREDCKMGTMLYTSTRYDLGDKRVESEAIDKIVSASARLTELLETGELPKYVYLDVYAYIHSGTLLKATRPGEGNPFSCRWDSGQCGIIYMTMKEVKKSFGGTSPEHIEQAMKCMAGEVEYFGKWLNGECYGYTLEDADGTEVDSCWGYVGDSDEVLESITKEIGE